MNTYRVTFDYGHQIIVKAYTKQQAIVEAKEMLECWGCCDQLVNPQVEIKTI